MAARREHIVVSGKRLGRAQKDPAKPRMMAKSILTPQALKIAKSGEHFSEVGAFGMYGNDKYGVCGPTSVANSRRLITRYLAGAEHDPAQEAVFDLYRRSGNPHFDPTTGADDNGVNVQEMLGAVVKGGIEGVNGVAFAEVNTKDNDEMSAALAVFGFLILGVDLQVAQQGQTEHHLWTYSGSAEWGGHAILGGRWRNYKGIRSDRLGAISWAEPVDMTASFMTHQLDEAWVLLWPEHMQSQFFMEAVNRKVLADEYRTLTGRTLAA